MSAGLRPGRLAWWAVCSALALGSLCAHLWPTAAIDWQPSLALREPWRAVSAAWVHWSARHALFNLAALMLLAVLGATTNAAPRHALAWLAAWPLTHFALLLQPEVAHYGGLSGVLHAGVACAAIAAIERADRVGRRVGALLLAGLAVKVMLEAPWRQALRPPGGGIDIAVAPLAHAAGALAGTLCATLASACARARRAAG